MLFSTHAKNNPNSHPDCQNTDGNALTGQPPKEFKLMLFLPRSLPHPDPGTLPECEYGDLFFYDGCTKIGVLRW
jgi:hypothetical protein